MGVLDGHEMNVKHYPPGIVIQGQPGVYALQFKASLIVPEEDFDSQRYLKRFVEAMEAIARLSGRQE